MKTVQILIFPVLIMLGACAQDNGQGVAQENEADQTTIDETVTVGGLADESADGTSETDLSETNAYSNLQETNVPEFEGIDIKLFELPDSSIYSIEKSLLFTTGTAGLRPEADQSLRKVSSSIKQRNQQGNIKIYGYIDPSDNPNYKRDVAQRRVEAVKVWLQESADLQGRHIAVQPIVELDASGSEATIKKDQRIEIVISNVNS